MTALSGWFNGRTPRERWLLATMVLLGLLWLGYTAVWQPLDARRDALIDQIARHDRAQAVLAGLPAQAVPATDSRPVPVILTDTATSLGLTIRRLEPDGAGARLVLEEVAFATVVLWLELLERDHGLRVTDLDLTRRPAPGLVSATLTAGR